MWTGLFRQAQLSGSIQIGDGFCSQSIALALFLVSGVRVCRVFAILIPLRLAGHQRPSLERKRYPSSSILATSGMAILACECK